MFGPLPLRVCGNDMDMEPLQIEAPDKFIVGDDGVMIKSKKKKPPVTFAQNPQQVLALAESKLVDILANKAAARARAQSFLVWAFKKSLSSGDACVGDVPDEDEE